MKTIVSLLKIVMIAMLSMLVVCSVIKLTGVLDDKSDGGKQIIYVEDITVEPDQIIF